MSADRKTGRTLRVVVVVGTIGAAAGLWFYSQLQSTETRFAASKEAADTLADEGSFAEAAEALHTSLEAARKFEPGDPRLDEILNRLGEVYGAQGLYIEAQHQYFASLQHRAEKHGPVHPEVADILFKLGRNYELVAQYESSEGMYNQAADIWQKLGKADDPAAISVYLGLARVLSSKQRYSEAADMHGKAVAIEERRVGENSAELAPLISAHAALLEAAGRQADAERELERSVRLAASGEPSVPQPSPSPVVDASPTSASNTPEAVSATP